MEVRRRPRRVGFGANFDPVSGLKGLGFTPTSGFRTQAHQEALIAQGLTKTRNSAHTRGDAVDFAVPQGMSKQQAIAQVLKMHPDARAIPSNGNSIHVTFPGWGMAPDISGSRRRFGGN